MAEVRVISRPQLRLLQVRPPLEWPRAHYEKEAGDVLTADGGGV